MFKKALFLCLYISLGLFLLNGCKTSATSNLQSVESDTLNLLLNIPDKATNVKLSFQYNTDDPMDLSFYIKECAIPVIRQEFYESTIINIKDICLQKGTYDVILNFKLNDKTYHGMDYISKYTKIENDNLLVKIVVTSSEDDTIQVNSHNFQWPEGYKCIGQKTIGFQTVYVLKKEGSTGKCSASFSSCLTAESWEDKNSDCVGATVTSNNTLQIEYVCRSGITK